MSEIQSFLKENAPESESTQRFLKLNYQDVTANAIYAAISADNQDCIKDLLKSQIDLESPNEKIYRLSNFKSSVSEALINYGESEITELPDEIQDIIAVVGYSLGRCDSLEQEDVSALFRKLEDGHARDIEDSLNHAAQLRANGELAPELSLPSRM
jgi:hypothetical protein